MGFFSRFKKNREKEEQPQRQESILTPEAQADQAKAAQETQAPAPDPAEAKKQQQFEELSPRLYPFFAPVNTPPFLPFETGGRRIDIPLPCIPFFSSKIFFVEDTGSSFRFLQKSAVPDSVSLQDLLRLSVRNLAQNVKFQVRAADFGYLIDGNPNHVSSFLLFKGLWKELAKKFDDNLLITVPVRGLILFVPEKKRQDMLPKMNAVCMKLIHDPKLRAHPLEPILFLYHREKDQLLPIAVRKNSIATAAPKPEQQHPEDDQSGEPLQEEIAKEGEDLASPPHLHIVPKPEPEARLELDDDDEGDDDI